MVQLELVLLGSPQVMMGEMPVSLASRKALALLIYLAVTQTAHSRDRLVTLFWPEQNAARGRSGLRQALWLLRHAGLAPWLQGEQDALALQPDYVCDLHSFQDHIEAGRIDDALALYRDEFLAGFSLRDCPEFDQWQFLQADDARRRLTAALEETVQAALVQGDYSRGLDYARRWLALDPAHEAAHRSLMQLYAYAGQHAAALRQYEECVRVLDEELDVPPDAETTALYTAIKARQLAAPAATPTPAAVMPPVPAPAANLPASPTSFVGRDQEVADIVERLARPDCQLLTLVGPGGVGKTRLALQVAGRQFDATQAALPEQIHVVSLQSLERPEFLPLAIAQALGLPLTQQDPVRQLVDFLRKSERLLVLDNLEHLLEGVTLLAAILRAAPRVKLLVTSREILNLQGEWIYPVQGLCYPPDEGDANAALLLRYDATRLFVERAQQVNPYFAAESDAAAVIRICRLVEGLPLAIELAAAWTRSLACTEIAAEIQRDLRFLASSLRDIPARHRSMRVVFDRSWEFLSAEERQVFQRLVVFHGGFGRDAAKTIADASLPILTALVDKSLLRMDAQGRYQLHELLRQYAREHLNESPEAAAHLQEEHARYYLSFVAARQARLVGPEQRHVVVEVAAEWENVRAAWLAAVDRRWADALADSCVSVQQFCDIQSRFREETELINRAYLALGGGQGSAAAGAADELAAAAVATQLGWCYIRVGRLAEAEIILADVHQSYTVAHRAPEAGFGTDPLPALALAVTAQGRYAQAIELGQMAIARLEAAHDEQNLLCACYVVGDAYLSQGDHDQAAHFTQRADALAAVQGNTWMQAYTQRNLGTIARNRGDYAQAKEHYQTSYTFKEELGDPEGMAMALAELAGVAYLAGDVEQATQLYRRSETLYRRLYDRGGLVRTLHGLGRVALAQEDLAAAADYLHEALTTAREAGLTPALLAVCMSAADWLAAIHRPDDAADLTYLAAVHPATDFMVRQAALAWANDRGHEATGRWQVGDVAKAAAWLQGVLEQPLPTAPPPAKASAVAGPQDVQDANQQLVEPLTERELEVLRLMAEGRSNRNIAEKLILAVGTVKSYTSQIYGKLGVDNRTQAILDAQERGLL